MDPIRHVRYCEGWDPESGSLVGPLSEATARDRDAAGEQYAVALLPPAGERPEMLVEVAWAEHYACAWHFDDQGRRSRKFELRRLAEDQVFLLESTEWTYDAEAPTEFDERAGLRERRYGLDGQVEDSHQPDGQRGGRRVTRPRVDPAGLVQPYAGFGDWATLAQLHRVDLDPPILEVVDWPAGTPVDGSVTPPWRPARPLRPRNLDVMFQPGTVLSRPDLGEVVVAVAEAGELVLPTGRLAVHDPGWLDFTGQLRQFSTTVAPGRYPVQLAVVRMPGQDGGLTVGARMVVRDEPAARWELALSDGEDVRLLGDEQFYGFGVDAGMGCLFDVSALEAFRAVVKDADETVRATPSDQACLLTDPDSGATLIAFHSGYGDGAYPTWIGRTEDGEIACFVVDLLVIDKASVTA